MRARCAMRRTVAASTDMAASGSGAASVCRRAGYSRLAFRAATARQATPLERDDDSSNRHPVPAYCWSMIFSENRYPLFGIMLLSRSRLRAALAAMHLDGDVRQP